MWRLLLFELILLVIVVGVWFLAPLVGIESVFWRVVIILALVIPPLALVIWNFISARRASKGLEGALKDQARSQEKTARPDRQSEITELNKRFNEAIASLKRSKLSGGKSALYALPWYMIIGPPAVGKSTALLRSGLKFPFSTGDRGAIKGVGGTRNCDWWFADQAILLDTAGRYTSEDEDQEEWVAFLRMVKRFRKKRPLNGLLVAVSIADLMTASREDVEASATKIRSRIDQVISELDLALPVYVLITKCDLISGFVQTFGNMKKSKRSQVFGFTVPLTSPTTDVEKLFQKEFDLLSARLQKRTLARLARAKSHDRSAIYKFPMQFGATRDVLSSFVGQLMMANPYVEMPRLRGIYFCSGTQEGRPLDTLMGAMGQALGLRGVDTPGLEQKAAKKSYFLRDVFTRVIFPDQDVAGTSAAGSSRARRLGIVALAVGFLAAATAVVGYAVSFGNNSEMVSATVKLAKQSRLVTPEDPRKVLGSIRAVDALGARVDQLQQYAEHGAPLTMGLGFYKGGELLGPARQIYIKRMRRAFVVPAGSELEATLVDIANSPGADSGALGAAKDFDLLKTYLMVTDRKRLDPKLAANVLLAQWRKRLHPDVSQERDLLLRNAERYLKLVKQGKATWLERDNDLVRNVRHVLRARDAEYRRAIGDAEKALRPFSLRDALRGQVQTLITAKHSVPGVYTRQGWTDFMRGRIAKQMVKKPSIEPWVLGEESSRNIGDRLRDRYYEQYIMAWNKFLDGLAIAPPTSAEESLSMLDKLVTEPSLFRELFKSVAYNTELPVVDTSKLKKGAKMLRGKAGRMVRRAQRLGALSDDKPKKPTNKVERAFWPVRELVHPPQGIDGRPQISGMDQYIGQMDKIRTELARSLKGESGGDTAPDVDGAVEEARRVTKGILAGLPGKLRRSLGPLLYAPLEVTSSTARAAEGERAKSSFSNELCAMFRERLAGKYPFARSRQDALLQDAIELFAPDKGLVWQQYESRYASLLTRKGTGFKAAPGKKVAPGIVSFFNRSSRITRALFPMGHDSPRLRIQVRPQPAVLAEGSDLQVSETTLEVEGKSKTYRNGPVEQWSFTWTGSGRRSRLLVRGAGGLREEISYLGDWGLLRLVDRGKARKRGSWYRVVWSFKGGKIRIPFDFRPARSTDPLFGSMKLHCK